jgi:hypothetical protein
MLCERAGVDDLAELPTDKMEACDRMAESLMISDL